MSATPKVLYVGIDGCRPDALAMAETPSIDCLRQEGVFFDNGLTCVHSNSGSCWASLLSGVWEDKHGIIDNRCEPAHFVQYPTIFQRLRDTHPNAESAAVVHWTTRHHPITEGVSHYRYLRSDARVTEFSCDLLDQDAPDLLYCLLNEVDDAGHQSGFDPDAKGYLAAIENADRHIHALHRSLQMRMQRFPEEDWLMLITTDHGGLGTRHGGDSPEERRTFMLFWAPRIQSRVDHNRVPVVAVVPTLMRHLNIPGDERLDGAQLTL